MIKVLHIVGARPQFMKLSPLYLEMLNNNFIQKILHTGQHFDENMSGIFFKDLNIPSPDFNLKINSLSHGAMTGRMIEGIENILLDEYFDYVIVYGDTNSTLAGAIAAKKLNIKIIHIESGVRNFDMDMPEEINRVLTDKISNLLFCTTEASLNNLLKEGAYRKDCFNVGDLMYDSSLLFSNKTLSPTPPEEYVLFTCHRASNTNKKNITEIINSLNIISKEINVIFPVHPRTKKIIDSLNIKINFECIEPVGYLHFLQLIKNSKYIITDSGGVVREAYFFKVPSILLLEYPVWPELTKANVCFNCPPIKKRILELYNSLKTYDVDFEKNENIFGDGDARKKIVNKITQYHKIK